MNPEITELLNSLTHGEVGGRELADWLAEASWEYLDSQDERERKVVADLAASLFDVQGGRKPEGYLADVAQRLIDILERDGRHGSHRSESRSTTPP